MQPVPESVFKQILSHNQFGLGVLTFDSAHVVAPYFGFVYVGHGPPENCLNQNLQNGSEFTEFAIANLPLPINPCTHFILLIL